MNDIEINQLADSWVADCEEDKTIDYDEDNPSAWKIVSDFELDDQHEMLWRFVLAAYTKNMSGRVFAILAAGPLEDLLAHFGTTYIDRVETLARQDPKFNELLGGVWKNAMSEEVWERVTSVRNDVW